MTPFELGVLVLLVVAAIPLGLSISRANELFALAVRDGRIQVSRGKAPPRLVSDLGDVVRRAGVASATLRVVKEDGRPRLVVASGVDDATAQRLRNVLGTWTLAQLSRK